MNNTIAGLKCVEIKDSMFGLTSLNNVQTSVN